MKNGEIRLDQTDVKILRQLQLDSRLSAREISKRVNLSAPSVTERIRKLEDAGVISGYTVQINYEALGFDIECMIQIDIKNSHFEQFKKYIYDDPRVNFCYRVAGHSCILVKLAVKTIAEIEAFVDAIANLEATTSTYIIFSEIPVNKSVEKFLGKMD